MQYIYFIRIPTKRICKIGITSDMKSRMGAIRYDWDIKLSDIKILFTKTIARTRRLEAYLHKKLKRKNKPIVLRGKRRKEYFSLNLFDRLFVLLFLNAVWISQIIVLILIGLIFALLSIQIAYAIQ